MLTTALFYALLGAMGVIGYLLQKTRKYRQKLKEQHTASLWARVEPLEPPEQPQWNLSMGDKPEKVAAWQKKRQQEAYVQQIIGE